MCSVILFRNGGFAYPVYGLEVVFLERFKSFQKLVFQKISGKILEKKLDGRYFLFMLVTSKIKVII